MYETQIKEWMVSEFINCFIYFMFLSRNLVRELNLKKMSFTRCSLALARLLRNHELAADEIPTLLLGERSR